MWFKRRQESQSSFLTSETVTCVRSMTGHNEREESDQGVYQRLNLRSGTVVDSESGE